jgi:hypothetical protein
MQESASPGVDRSNDDARDPLQSTFHSVPIPSPVSANIKP